VAGVWAGNSDHAPGHSVMSLEMAAPIWHAFMQDATAGTPVTDFKQPSGVTWATVDAYSGMLPGPYTTQTVNEVFVNGTCRLRSTRPRFRRRRHGHQHALDVRLPGHQGHQGLPGPEPGGRQQPDWQKYDQIWIARAQQGVGEEGGPNNGATMYFYQTGFWTPFGQTWGAPFPPTDVLHPEHRHAATVAEPKRRRPTSTPTPADAHPDGSAADAGTDARRRQHRPADACADGRTVRPPVVACRVRIAAPCSGSGR
jgi:membrane peptidoglycan carboxypeptidase